MTMNKASGSWGEWTTISEWRGVLGSGKASAPRTAPGSTIWRLLTEAGLFNLCICCSFCSDFEWIFICGSGFCITCIMFPHRGRQLSTVAKIRVRISLTLPVEDVLYCNILQTDLESLFVYVAELLHPSFFSCTPSFRSPVVFIMNLRSWGFKCNYAADAPL